MARDIKKGTAWRRPVAGSVKKVEERTERNNGERPNTAILKPVANPGRCGSIFVAAKTDEKYLCQPVRN